ncbi:DUF3160 domain-containing protein [Chloroflexota bacterium]
MKARFFLLLMSIVQLACWLTTPPTPIVPTRRPKYAPSITPTRPPPTVNPQRQREDSFTSNPAQTATAVPGELASLVDLTAGDFASLEMTSWKPDTQPSDTYNMPVDRGLVVNQQVTAGLTYTQRSLLANNGFVVIHSQEPQFSDIRQRVSKQFGQPYYLTTDAAYHAFHLNYDELLEALEREELRPRMIAVTQSVMDEVLSYYALVQGTSLEGDTRLAAAYMAVGLKLLEPQTAIDPLIESPVMDQVDQIMAGGGIQNSTLIPDLRDDYSAYSPTGHYSGDEDLENYYRAMTWFGRVHFKLSDREPGFIPSRSPLIITQALRHAQIDGKTTAEEWTAVHEAITYLIGQSDDAGPIQYSKLMDQIYGPRATIISLKADDLWQVFLQISQSLPLPQINSTFGVSLSDMESERGWRFMGQRFSPDAFILQNLVYDKVGTSENRRKLPSGLDIMAALGSPAAMQALEETDATDYFNYPEQMEQLQAVVNSQDEVEWLETANSAWLYTFLPQVDDKTAPYPDYMRTGAWKWKDLNSALGSWAELKHDTVLYSKMPEMAGGGGPPSSGPAPGFVEPNPLVLFRLAYLAHSISDGLTERDMVGESSYDQINLSKLLNDMQHLGDHFQKLGDIAVKELQGIPLSEDDYSLIQSPIGALEERVLHSQLFGQHETGSPQRMPPVPVIAAAAGAEEQILQVATGAVDRIYVIVPINGEQQIAQGGVFSYYEFPQPRSERISDREWRLLLTSNPPDMPEWTDHLLLSGGNPIDVQAFRAGDVYLITRAGENLNLRRDPSLKSESIQKLQVGEYVMIVEGPIHAEGFTWWKLKTDLHAKEPIEGWAVENPEWYERAWGQ